MPRWVLFALIAAQFAAFVDRSLPAALAPQIKATFHLDDARLGALQGPAFVALYAAAAIGAIWVVASHRRSRIAALCVLGWTLGTIGIAFASSYPQLVAARLVTGIAQAMFAPCALALILESTPGRARGRRTSMFTVGAAVGRSAGFLLTGMVLGGFGAVVAAVHIAPWCLAMLLMVAPNLAVSLALACAPESAQPQALTRSERPNRAAAWRWAAEQREAWLCVTLIAACGVLSIQTLSAWGASLLHRRFGLSAAEAATVFGGALVPAALIGHLGGGWLADRLRRITVLDVTAGALVLSFGAMAVAAGSPREPVVICALAVAAIAASMAALCGLVAMQEMTPPSSRAVLGAVFLASTSLLGFGVGPLTAGMLSDAHGQSARALAGSLTLLLGVSAAFGAGTAWLGRSAWLRARTAAQATAAA